MTVKKELTSVDWTFSTRNLQVDISHTPTNRIEQWHGYVTTRMEVGPAGDGSREAFLYSLHTAVSALHQECAEMMECILEDIRGGMPDASEDPQSAGWTPSVYSQGGQGEEDNPQEG